MTAQDVDALLADARLHVSFKSVDECKACGDRWPCQVNQLALALSTTNRELGEARHLLRVRADHAGRLAAELADATRSLQAMLPEPETVASTMLGILGSYQQPAAAEKPQSGQQTPTGAVDTVSQPAGEWERANEAPADRRCDVCRLPVVWLTRIGWAHRPDEHGGSPRHQPQVALRVGGPRSPRLCAVCGQPVLWAPLAGKTLHQDMSISGHDATLT